MRILLVRDFPFAKGLVVDQLGATFNDAATKEIDDSSRISVLTSKARRNAYSASSCQFRGIMRQRACSASRVLQTHGIE
jgi:hypothetical protein